MKKAKKSCHVKSVIQVQKWERQVHLCQSLRIWWKARICASIALTQTPRDQSSLAAEARSDSFAHTRHNSERDRDKLALLLLLPLLIGSGSSRRNYAPKGGSPCLDKCPKNTAKQAEKPSMNYLLEFHNFLSQKLVLIKTHPARYPP